MDDSNLVTGIVLYRREQWTRLRELAADPEKLEESYEDWLAGVQKFVVEMAVAGVRTRRVDVDIEDLLRWCQAEGRPLDSSARAAFAASPLRRAHGGAGPEPTV